MIAHFNKGYRLTWHFSELLCLCSYFIILLTATTMKLVHWKKLPESIINDGRLSLWTMGSHVDQKLIVDKTQIFEWFKISKVTTKKECNPRKGTSVSWLCLMHL